MSNNSEQANFWDYDMEKIAAKKDVSQLQSIYLCQSFLI